MMVLINAFKGIDRSKGRNILIGIIVLGIAASSCVALSIKNAAKEAELDGLSSITITGSISVDRQKISEEVQGESSGGGMPNMERMRELMEKYPDLSLDELLQYADSDFVKDFYYSSSVALNGEGDLEAYGSDEENDDGFSEPEMQPDGSMVSESSDGRRMRSVGRAIGGMRMTMGDFNVMGFSSESAMSKFNNGTAVITDGEMFDFDDSTEMRCLISNELALFNGLKVGDKITLSNPNFEEDDEQEETYEFTIVGVYTDSSSSDTGDMPMFSTSQDPANLICTSYSAIKAIADNSTENAVTGTNDWGMETTTALMGSLSSTLAFSSKENYESFNEELTAKGLSEYYVLSSYDLNNYESSVIPLKNLSEFATMLLLIVLATGAVILIVINVFNIRERKYEVGVLTAIGIKKGKVAMQFVTELLCVTLVAIIIGSVVGAVVSVPIANNLLSAQIEQAQAQQQSQEESFGRPGGGGQSFSYGGGGGGGPVVVAGGPGGGRMMSIFGEQAEISYMDKIEATVNFSILGQLILIGIALTFISSLAAVIFVMRYEPLKILANRA